MVVLMSFDSMSHWATFTCECRFRNQDLQQCYIKLDDVIVTSAQVPAYEYVKSKIVCPSSMHYRLPYCLHINTNRRRQQPRWKAGRRGEWVDLPDRVQPEMTPRAKSCLPPSCVKSLTAYMHVAATTGPFTHQLRLPSAGGSAVNWVIESRA